MSSAWDASCSCMWRSPTRRENLADGLGVNAPGTARMNEIFGGTYASPTLVHWGHCRRRLGRSRSAAGRRTAVAVADGRRAVGHRAVRDRTVGHGAGARARRAAGVDARGADASGADPAGPDAAGAD